MIYGKMPKDLGLIDITCNEMMLYQYLPIKIPGLYYPSYEFRLDIFKPILQVVYADLDKETLKSSYMYITAKHVYVSGEKSGNRPGWHSDGFMTDDINYIWSDCNPTKFVFGNWEFIQDDKESLLQMANLCHNKQTYVYPDKHLLKLDQFVIHKAPEDCEPGFRTFVKISVSKHQYNLIGNSINYLSDNFKWDMKPRSEDRNPTTK